MTDKQREIKEARLNEVAKAWKAAKVIPGNEAETLKLRNDAWVWSDKLFNPKMGDPDKEAFISDTIFNCIMNYNPDKGAFCNYLSRVLNRRVKGYYAESYEKEAREESMSAPASSGSDDSLTNEDTLASKTNVAGEVIEHIRVVAFIVEMTALVSDFYGHHHGHAANETRRMWYRLFYTENITSCCRVDPSLLQHPRDVFQTMDLGYLDYYMSEPCRTPKEVELTPLKPYCDVVPDSGDRSTEWLEGDFPGDVSLFYLLKTTGSKPGRSARSNQLKFYREELKGLL